MSTCETSGHIPTLWSLMSSSHLNYHSIRCKNKSAHTMKSQMQGGNVIYFEEFSLVQRMKMICSKKGIINPSCRGGVQRHHYICGIFLGLDSIWNILLWSSFIDAFILEIYTFCIDTYSLYCFWCIYTFFTILFFDAINMIY